MTQGLPKQGYVDCGDKKDKWDGGLIGRRRASILCFAYFIIHVQKLRAMTMLGTSTMR
jgi:hypothetical protein